MFYIPVPAVRYVQKCLARDGYDPGPTDGDLGPRTERALDRLLDDRADDLGDAHRGDILSGSRKRKLTAYIQLLARDADIESGPIDGLWGSQTDYAWGSLEHIDLHDEPPGNWRDAQPLPNPNGWPMQDEASLRAFYGDPGENLVMVDVPYPHRLSWDKRTTVNRTKCHERVAASIERVLGNVLDHYGMDRIKTLRLDLFGGCYNHRTKRGGSTLSTHAWGIALDYDPERNPFRAGRAEATFSKPVYKAWWTFWEEEGWVSLGRRCNFDWMHVQAARLPENG